MKYLILIPWLLGSLMAQSNYTISGQARDGATGEDLIGVTVMVKELPNKGALSNTYGFYSLTLPAGEYTLICRYLGYETQELAISLIADQRQDLSLKEEAVQLDEVVIA
ncbi:MAG: carboxypeptidase-like regulatory domain-containing protein, partial [Bacteroidota bacterium]